MICVILGFVSVEGANFTTPPLIYSDFHIFNTFRSMAWRGREALLPERKGEARSRVVLQQMALLPRRRYCCCAAATTT